MFVDVSPSIILARQMAFSLQFVAERGCVLPDDKKGPQATNTEQKPAGAESCGPPECDGAGMHANASFNDGAAWAWASSQGTTSVIKPYCES